MRRRLTVVLSTIFAARGGIPRFNQMLCLALDRIAPELRLDITVLSQDDDEEHYAQAGSPWKQLQFVPGRGQARLLATTFARCARTRQDLMLIGLLGMTPVGFVCRPFVRGGFGFIAHGLDIWDETRASRFFLARRARFVLAVSRYTARSVSECAGVPASRVHLLHNTLDPGFELTPLDSSTENEAAPELLTVARLTAEESKKGVDHTIEAFAELALRYPQARYRIVGRGSDQPRLAELARSLNVADRVVFEQDVSDELLAQRYRECSLFVMPSGQEGFGIVFLEAMRFGKPCVGGSAGGTPDVIADEETGLLVPFDDRRALCAALDRLLGDAALRRRFGAAGRARLESLFVFSQFQARLREHLERLLPPSRA